jgi:NADH-quinone oxidoreductase subunit L
MMMIGTLAITGVGIPLLYIGFPIGFAGFVSKDAIIESAFASGNGYAFWMLVIAALMTSFYSWRLMFLTFYGKPRGDKHTHDHAHESPNVMLVPLAVLAVGAIFSGMYFYKPFFKSDKYVGEFFGVLDVKKDAEDHASLGFSLVAPAYAAGDETDAHAEEGNADDAHADDAHADEGHGDDHAGAWPSEPGKGAIFKHPDNHVLHEAHNVPWWVKLSPFVAMRAGFLLAFQMYIRKPHLPAKLAEQQAPLYNFLLNKWYFDELYDVIFVRPATAIGRFLWKQGDTNTIDGGINGLAMGIVPFFTRLANKAQSGYMFTYAFAMVLGITVLLTYVTLFGGAG